jgi:hypothetical protein
MDITLLLAQMLGIIFIVMSLSLLINKRSTVAVIEEAIHNKGFLWTFGFIALVMGAVLVVLNNLWNSGLQSLVSLMGWLCLLKGAYLLILPDSAVALYRKCNRSGIITLSGWVALILGLVLFYKGVVG